MIYISKINVKKIYVGFVYFGGVSYFCNSILLWFSDFLKNSGYIYMFKDIAELK